MEPLGVLNNSMFSKGFKVWSNDSGIQSMKSYVKIEKSIEDYVVVIGIENMLSIMSK